MGPLRTVLDLLFPPRCLGCDVVGAFFCMACLEATRRLDDAMCPACRVAVDPEQPHCRCRRHALLYVRAAGTYDNQLRLAIHRFKYGGKRAAADDLAVVLDRAIAPFAGMDPILVPIPLHPGRQRQRGYNQAALLARAASVKHGMRVEDTGLQRVRATPPQVGMSAEERARNIRGAFSAEAGAYKGRSVVLVDDVCTTGATLRAAADALRGSGARHVYAAVLALATIDRDR